MNRSHFQRGNATFGAGVMTDDSFQGDEGWVTYCPLDEGEGVYLGRLGRNHFYRCRDCGMDFFTSEEQS